MVLFAVLVSSSYASSNSHHHHHNDNDDVDDDDVSLTNEAGDEPEVGYCAPYNGKVCKSFISSSQVWYSRQDGSNGWVNEQIATGLWEEMILGLHGLCRTAAEVRDGRDCIPLFFCK